LEFPGGITVEVDEERNEEMGVVDTPTAIVTPTVADTPTEAATSTEATTPTTPTGVATSTEAATPTGAATPTEAATPTVVGVDEKATPGEGGAEKGGHNAGQGEGEKEDKDNEKSPEKEKSEAEDVKKLEVRGDMAGPGSGDEGNSKKEMITIRNFIVEMDDVSSQSLAN
jgi:hypothetical protein